MVCKFAWYIAIFVLIHVFSGCKDTEKSTKNNYKHLTINLYESTVEEVLSTIKRIEFIPLETKPEALIGSIQKIIANSDYFYLLDVFSAKSVFVFNRAGKHIETIDTNGKGPGEFVTPWDMSVDPYNEKLIIVDPGNQKILKYSLEGEFEDEVYTDFTPYSIGFVNCDTYCFKTMVDNLPGVVTAKSNGKQSSVVFLGTREFNMNLFSHFSRSGEKQFYLEFVNDTIYEIGPDYSIPYAYIDFQELSLTPQKKKELKEIYHKFKNIPGVPQDLAGAVAPFFETKKFISFLCEYKDGMAKLIINKQTSDQSLLYKYPKCENMWIKLLFQLNFAIEPDTFVGKISSADYLELMNSDTYHDLKKQGVIKQPSHQIPNMQSNPVLVSITYK